MWGLALAGVRGLCKGLKFPFVFWCFGISDPAVEAILDSLAREISEANTKRNTVETKDEPESSRRINMARKSHCRNMRQNYRPKHWKMQLG